MQTDLGALFDLESNLAFIKCFCWLAEFRYVEFFTKDLWNRSELPKAWRDFAEALEEDQASDKLISLAENSLQLSSDFTEVTKFVKNCYELSFVSRSLANRSLAPAKRKKVSEKKTYEIEKLADLLFELVTSEKITTALDVGAGQGYLAFELMNRKTDLKVVGIDCSDVQVHGTLKRLNNEPKNVKDRFRIEKVRLDGRITCQEFESQIGVETGYLMYSLHACGSLSETMLSLFSSSDSKAKVLFNVACCYHLIDESTPGTHFPMSRKILNSWGARDLTWNMKMVAGQAPYRWSLNPSSTDTFFQRHYFRALLEWVLIHYKIASVLTSKIASVPDSYLSDFSRYCAKVFEKMGIENNQIPDSSKLLEIESQFRSHKKLLAFVWTMRALIGMPIEALVIFDRYLFLKEMMPSSTVVELVSVFDPRRSPRNMALLAVRK